MPSFAGSTPGSAAACYLKYDSSDGNYKTTLTDTNGVLRYFTIDLSSLPRGLEVILDYDNNTMTIICDDKSILKSGTIIIRLLSLLDDGDASVYFHPLYQDLVIPDNKYGITVSAYIKPLISEPKPVPKNRVRATQKLLNAEKRLRVIKYGKTTEIYAIPVRPQLRYIF